MSVWQVQEAKARFCALLDVALEDGPQVVTRRGVEAAVLVPIEQWRRLQQASHPTLKDWLLAPEPRFDTKIPPLGKVKLLPTVEFE